MNPDLLVSCPGWLVYAGPPGTYWIDGDPNENEAHWHDDRGTFLCQPTLGIGLGAGYPADEGTPICPECLKRKWTTS